MKKVRKAVIPAAGLGTRFLPATKALPKEMLPIVNKPTIQYIVEEAVEAGIEDIIIVTGKGKRAIEDHFDTAYELEQNLIKKNKLDLLEKVREPSKIDIHYIRQKSPQGLGHAVWCARKFIGDEPFAVLLGDDIVQAETPCIKQLINQYEKTGCSCIGVKEVPENQTHRYGIIDPKAQDGRLFDVRKFVEKPESNPPSNMAIIGRYVLTPEIFDFLDKKEIGAGGEIQLTDAIQKLNELQGVFAYQFEGKRYDVGETLGFVLTNIEMALQDKTIQKDVLKGIERILHNNRLPLE
ncbi:MULTISPECIES: UTP--glucose-1-phosphate uridylyltransferase GalU [Sporolactobacillus]|uniref:UTP--glucose-1-phosphate uridylyltransferase n=1 Tax=Sporolactobacillus inulinus TaxID=2078 RepID=A0A4Y1ZC55_9BACL|nr:MULTISPECIES: UTP--glucose-1-phosphate uridylyltransferase GalU [Sporolactobacillus]UAK16352.1 UTP--glucose-1-phosphate uridylyltransferase GalU [Sporolactobacillus terrae]GAY76248.1 UTP-glucose-1-phosphate uridylyltransferase [Sporolactobacillus inulinus]